jgi:hypothetical protein
LRALPDQEIPRAEYHRPGLLLFGLNGNERIVGRDPASAMASASAVSFFCRFTYGLT